MKKYKVIISKPASKELAKLPPRIQVRISGVIEMLAINPFPPKARKLQGRDGYRIRTNDYRILYSVSNVELRILVLKVSHRRDVYK